MKRLIVLCASDYPEWFLKKSESQQQEYIKERPRSLPAKLWNKGIKPIKKIKKLKTTDSTKQEKTIDTEIKKPKVRKSANAKQLKQRVSVLDNLNKILKRIDKSGKSSVLGLKVVKEFKTYGATKIVGKTVNSAKDLAFISQIYRNPLMETFRMIYVKDGKIVGHNTISQRLPASVTFPKNIENDIYRDIKNLGADTYYMLHNHPSGSSEPGRADIRTTQGLSEDITYLHKIDEYKHIDEIDFGGHVVINHKEYSFIDQYGNVSNYDSNTLEETYDSAKSVIDHPVLGKTITAPQDLAVLNAELYLQAISPDTLTFIGTSGQRAEVQLLVSLPKDFLLDKNKYSYKKVASYIRHLSKTAGKGSHRFFSVPEEFDDESINKYRHLIEHKIVNDISDKNGVSLYQLAVNKGIRFDMSDMRDIIDYKGKSRFKGVNED